MPCGVAHGELITDNFDSGVDIAGERPFLGQKEVYKISGSRFQTQYTPRYFCSASGLDLFHLRDDLQHGYYKCVSYQSILSCVVLHQTACRRMPIPHVGRYPVCQRAEKDQTKARWRLHAIHWPGFFAA